MSICRSAHWPLVAAWRLLTERYHLERQRFDLAGCRASRHRADRADPRSLLRTGMGWISPRLLGSIGLAVAALAGAGAG